MTPEPLPDQSDFERAAREHVGHRLSVMVGEDVLDGLMCDTCGEYVWEFDDADASDEEQHDG